MNALIVTEDDAGALLSWADEHRNPLRLEMAGATSALGLPQLQVLRGIGLPAPQLHADGMIGVARGLVDKSDFWAADEGGSRLLITPLIESGVVVDLIAFDPKQPNAWFLRTGHGWALGADTIARAQNYWPDDGALVLHATPLDWLASGCEGACVTQWTDEARTTIRGIHACEVRSSEFARALRLELTRPPRIPEIQVRRWQNRAA
jgi:hypothetical protein